MSLRGEIKVPGELASFGGSRAEFIPFPLVALEVAAFLGFWTHHSWALLTSQHQFLQPLTFLPPSCKNPLDYSLTSPTQNSYPDHIGRVPFAIGKIHRSMGLGRGHLWASHSLFSLPQLGKHIFFGFFFPHQDHDSVGKKHRIGFSPSLACIPTLAHISLCCVTRGMSFHLWISTSPSVKWAINLLHRAAVRINVNVYLKGGAPQ